MLLARRLGARYIPHEPSMLLQTGSQIDTKADTLECLKDTQITHEIHH